MQICYKHHTEILRPPLNVEETKFKKAILRCVTGELRQILILND